MTHAPSHPRACEADSPQPLRILVCGPLSADDGGRSTGGVATHVSDLVRQLAAAGHEVAVYADNLAAGRPDRRSWGTAYPPLPRAGVPASAATLNGGLAAVRRALAGAGELNVDGWCASIHALGVRRAVCDFKPDVVHYHHAETRPAFGRMAGVTTPSVITVHSLSAFRDDGGSGLKSVAVRNIAESDAVIAVSTDTAEAVTANVPGASPVILPNGIDVAAFSADSGERPAQATGAPLILYLGWVATYKGVLDAVEALATVRVQVPDATLAVVGPEIDLTLEQVRSAWSGPAEALITLPPVQQAGVIAWLHAADVLVLPSRVREGGPRVLLEAFAAGTPVIAADVGAVAEVLGHGERGRLVQPARPDELASAIVEALTGSDATRQRAETARAAMAQYDSAAFAERVVAVYRAAIASRQCA